MIYLFIPYYNEFEKPFINSLARQNVSYRLIKRDRKRDKIYWTKAVNDFRKDLLRYRGVKDTDVICIMNNDISFSDTLLEEGSQVREGGVYIPEGVKITWGKKKFELVQSGRVDTFAGRCFFMTYQDFNRFKFSKLLPHYLSDYDYGIKVCKKLKPVIMQNKLSHWGAKPKHPKFSILNPGNPIFWTIFLLKHPNRYTPLNLLKAWL